MTAILAALLAAIAGFGHVTIPPPPPANWMVALTPEVDPNGYGAWVFQRNGGYGASDGVTVWIDPDVPEEIRADVMAHEFGHVMQARVYGSLDGARAVFGRSGVESMADCMAQAQGAVWVWYGCDESLRVAGVAILAGERA